MATYATVQEQDNLVITVGIQGPPGVDGTGLAIVSESPPSPAVEGDIWYNPLTKVEKIYASGDWQDTSVDGLYF